MKEFVKKFKVRKIILGMADAVIIICSAFIASYASGLYGSEVESDHFLISLLCRTCCCVAGLLISGAYSKLWRYFKPKDYLSCAVGTTVGMTFADILIYETMHCFSLPYAFFHWCLSVLSICVFRFVFKRTFIELVDSGKKAAGLNKKRTMIIGAGQASKMLLKELESIQEAPGAEVVPFEPVCIIDDEKSLIGSYIRGVQVVGTTSDIKKFVETMKIEQIILAIPSCIEDERKRIIDICAETKLPLKIIPFIGNLIFDDKQTPLLRQVRSIKTEELLGRDPIKFDNEDVKEFIGGKVCMVTGGGGSIGSELVRQIAKYSPKQVIIVDIYENNAYDIQQELMMEYKDKLNLVTLIGSVRDYYRMNNIFEKYKPEVVFHAAAHKHVPLMEVSPMEAIKNNIMGTFNVATLAQYHNVKKFVMISTDKAVNPTNAMGASKRCCEMIIQYLSQQNEGVTEFVTTRFGNVLGSNGSVIPLFKKQIESGLPVTVTHPDIIRYFMTIPEAVSLVMEAAAIAHGGEIFVLDMGQPVKIVTLAENLIHMYGKEPYKDIPIKFIGLRPGEKIKEELLMNEEGLTKTKNKLIFIGRQIEINEETFAAKLRELRDASLENDENKAMSALHDMVPSFITPEEFNKKILDGSSSEKTENDSNEKKTADFQKS